MMIDTITCLLCQGVVAFAENDQSRYKSHLSVEHNTFYYIPWLISKTIKEFEKKTVKAFENNGQNPANMTKTSSIKVERFQHQNVSVSIRKVIPEEELPMEEGNVKEEVIDNLNNMNTEELLAEDESEDITDKNASISIGKKSKNKNKQCTLCDKHFARIQNLTRHMETIHGRNPKDPKPYHCSVCDKTFKTESYVLVHEKKHMGGYIFRNQVGYNRTMGVLGESTDTLEEEFQCDACPKTFRTKSFMKTHMKSHTIA